MASAIRIGIVGAGDNTRVRHIPGLQAQEGVEIVSVCNRSRASSQRVAREFGIPTIHDNWRELVASDAIDAVVIGTWPYLHCPITLAALEAGKHVMTEARMAMDAGQARLMLEESQANPHLVTQIVPSPITLRVDGMIRKLVAEGYLGEILAVDVTNNANSFVDRSSLLHWRHDRNLSGFNILAMGIWYEALMRWVGEAVEVTAMTQVNVTPARHPRGSAANHHHSRPRGHPGQDGLRSPGANAVQCSDRPGRLHLQELAVRQRRHSLLRSGCRRAVGGEARGQRSCADRHSG